MNPKVLFDELRAHSPLGPTLDQGEVDGVTNLLRACQGLPLSHAAYILATAWHETAGTMLPIKEYGSRSYFTRLYDVQGEKPERARKYGNTQPGDGPKYCGRGYVQVTWKNNYALADRVLGLKGALVANPDLAMRPDIAAVIIVAGMTKGWFTGERLKDTLGANIESRDMFWAARDIVNGAHDKAERIALAAMDFQAALSVAGWGK